MGFFAPGMAAGITQGLDQYANRQNTEQLMAARAQRMREEAMQQQMLVAQHNQQIEAQRGGGQTLGFLMNGPMPPQPGQASVSMQRPPSPMQAPPQSGQPGMPNIDVNATSAQNFANLRQWAEANPPPGQTSADYPNWKPGMAPRSLREGVIPFNQPIALSVGSDTVGDMGPARTAMLDYEGVPPQAGRVELGTVNAEPPRPVIPPYKTINRNPEQPPQAQNMAPPPPVDAAPPPVTPPEVTQPTGKPQGGGGFLSLRSVLEAMQKNGVPPDKWLAQLNQLKPVLDMQSKEELAQVTAQFKEAKTENDRQRRLIDTYKAETQEKNVNSLVDTREERLPMEQQRADAATAQAAASGKRASNAGQATPGNINTALTRMSKEMGPIDEAQRQTSEIRGLIATANAASTPQIQRILSNYMNAGRTTNQLYVSNANFGNMYERGANALSRLTQGDYSDANKQQVLDMVNQMDSSVFAPARAKLNSKYRMQAEHMRINPDVFDNQNTFSESAAPPSAAKPKTSTESLRQWAGSPKGSVDMGNGWSVTERK